MEKLYCTQSKVHIRHFYSFFVATTASAALVPQRKAHKQRHTVKLATRVCVVYKNQKL